MTGHSDQIAKIKQLEKFVRFFADIIQLHVDLQPMAGPINVSEARFPMQAKGENAPGHTHHRLGDIQRGCVSGPVFLEQFLRRCRPIEFMRIGLVPARLDLGKLFLALQKLIGWLKR